MLRRGWLKASAASLAILAAIVVIAGAVVAAERPAGSEAELSTLLASLLLLFPVLAFTAGMAAGGGTEVIPMSQLIAYPLSPRAVFVASVLMTPLNVAWTLQAAGITWLAAYVGARGSAGTGLVGLALLFVVAATTAGLALSWFVTAARSGRRGRRLIAAVVALLAGLLLRALLAGGQGLIDALPLSDLAVALVLSEPRTTAVWAATLVSASAVGIASGSRATAWALRRRDDDAGAREDRLQRRRPWRPSRFLVVFAVDWASARRSKPVRRGMILFAVVPGLAGLAAGMPWQDMVVLPGLVATGAALLFGVNSFALDGSGATWLESTPRSARHAFASKALAVATVTTLVVTGALLLTSVRAQGAPEPATAVALAQAVISAVMVSTAVAMHASMHHPHKADLRTARDAPAPPAAMTVHSVRLVAATSVVGVAYAVTVRLPGVWPSLILTGVVAAASLAHLRWSLHTWQRQRPRSRVVAAVSFG